ncbi:MAG: two-component regulator propeller domain-containing protein [Rubricoccaceae bacterium]|nr:two-component regulator propeller domain-containing protein [Rubricoccaceae bacterium]
MRIGVVFRAVPVLLVLLSAAGAQAQLRDWQAYPSLREVVGVAASGEAVWAATGGGVYAFRPGTGEVTRYTPVQGLHGVETAAIAYDDAGDAVWVGYTDGVLDRLDVATGAVTSFFDIARADQYADRAVRRLRVQDGTLYVATAFGLVVFDPARGEVRETYARLGDLDPATPVNDALEAPLPDGRPGLWVATVDGVAYASLDAPNLQQPSAWTLDSAGPTTSDCLAFFDGAVYACAAAGAERRQADGTWSQVLFWGVAGRDLAVDGDYLYSVVQNRLIRLAAGGGRRVFDPGDYPLMTSVALGPDGQAWVGSEVGGLLRLPPLGPENGGEVRIEPEQVVVPDGPFNNAVRALAVRDDVLWTSHDRIQNAIGIGRSAASRLDETGWTLFVEGEADVPEARLISASLGPDGTFYAASQGDGLLAVSPDGDALTYDAENATLLEATGTDLVDLGDAVVDAAGRLWVTNRFSPLPLHVRAPEGAWTGLPLPSTVPNSVDLVEMVIDPFDQKWFTARRNTGNQGAGVVALSTGADPFSAADDVAVHIDQVGTNGTGLPSEDVTALALDGQGRLWIGTARGLAIIFSPGAVLGGDAALATPQWARTADGADYLLRDLAVNDFAVDPAGQLWIGSTTGAWRLNADGDAVELQLTTENSPLFSDNVVAVEVDPVTGRVYFATDRGLLSAAGEATAPSPTVRDLAVAPSPYRPAQHSRGVLISGLVAETTVYVLTPDGRRIAALDARGGSVRWDGRDERTGELVTSGVYLVAAVAADGEATAHGKVAVIR